MRGKKLVWCALCSALVAPSIAGAKVTELVLTTVESPTFEGVEFGATGQYERKKGHARGLLDPDDPLNSVIVNLDKAPRNSEGLVEYRVDVDLLKPLDLTRGNGWILYDVVNRGNKLANSFVNRGGGGNDPRLASDAGTGFLMERGYTIVWSAWQGDITAGNDRLVADFPIATDDGEPIVGLSREEFIDASGDSPFVGNLVYPAVDLDPSQATLTVRENEMDPRQTPPGLAWEYVDENQISITRPTSDEFDAGAIYEFIYPAKDPIVMGIGLAATRDVVSYLRYEKRGNPLKLGRHPYAERAMGLGISQSGRFLRDLIYQGFNEDEVGRQVFDGAIPVIAGSRKTFTNYEFAQPGRFSRQHEDHLFPGDQFPFSYAEVTDPISGLTDSILARCEDSDTCPKVMHFDSETEVWQARGSLVVTDTAGADLELPDNVRAYFAAGTQHGPAAEPSFGICQQLSNPLDYAPILRAVMVALEQWIADGRKPPESRYGSVDDGTLVLPENVSYPAIPDFTYDGLINRLRLNDHSVQPPEEGEGYPVYVAKVDADGNAVAGIEHPLLRIPAATHLGWNLRAPAHAEGELCNLSGSYIPFAENRAEREAAGDPRLSTEERYPSQGAYVGRVARAAAKLVRERLLLTEDAERIIDAAIQLGVGAR